MDHGLFQGTHPELLFFLVHNLNINPTRGNIFLMFNSCSICGGSWNNNLTCQKMFDEFLALEFSNPAYGRVHMLTVACFMIQHQRYSDRALELMKIKLDEVVNKGVSPADIRLQMNQDVDQSNRGWKIERQSRERDLPHIHWSITIANVFQHKDDPVSYCDWVVKWAKATLLEMRIED